MMRLTLLLFLLVLCRRSSAKKPNCFSALHTCVINGPTAGITVSSVRHFVVPRFCLQIAQHVAPCISETLNITRTGRTNAELFDQCHSDSSYEMAAEKDEVAMTARLVRYACEKYPNVAHHKSCFSEIYERCVRDEPGADCDRLKACQPRKTRRISKRNAKEPAAPSSIVDSGVAYWICALVPMAALIYRIAI
ncbi:unnamed protein product, partial [Mesorhabditis spiculigera]